MKLCLVEGVDYIMEGNKLVFTSHFLLRRGYCCNSRCRNCPYKNEKLPAELSEEKDIQQS